MNTNPLETIRSYTNDFTKTDQQIADYILENPSEVIVSTLAALANKCGVSDAAMIRFSHRIGYSGFAPFKNDVARYIFTRNGAQPETESTSTPLTRITEMYANYIKKIASFTDMDTINRIADLFLQSNRVKIFGYNRTSGPSRQLRLRLSKISYDAEALTDAALLSDMSSLLDEKDLLILFTIRDGSRYKKQIEALRKNGCKIVVVTMVQTLAFASLCNEVVVLPRISKDPDAGFLDDQAIFFVFIEVLLEAIAEKSRQYSSR